MELNCLEISGMHSKHKYIFCNRNRGSVLTTESWIRVIGGSGEQHKITPEKVELVARGSV